MRPALILVCVLLLTSSVMSAESPRDVLITPTSAGRIALGDRAETVLSRYRDHPRFRMRESTVAADEYRTLVLSEDRELLASAVVSVEGDISKIIVYSNRFRTDKGIRVGSTLTELTNKYGKPRIVRGEGAVAAAYKLGDGALIFQLDHDADSDRPPPGTSKVVLVAIVPATNLERRSL